MHDWQTFVDNAFAAGLTGCVAFGVKFMADLSKSLTKLNNKFIEKMSQHESRITRLETLEPRRNHDRRS